MEAPVDLPPNFNSSDFEVSDVEQEQPRKKRKSGHGIAEAILRNQASDRLESKKSLRTLQFAHGAPGTKVNHDTVMASWDAFVKPSRSSRFLPSMRSCTCPSKSTFQMCLLTFLDEIVWPHVQLVTTSSDTLTR
jgi:hypothetical protein